MPNNSCTIILNGHGSYKANYIINLTESHNHRVQNGLSPINYNIVFCDGLKKPVSDAQHNMLLDYLHTNTMQSLTNLENYPTTYVSNRNINSQPGIINMEQKRVPYIHEHYLSNAPDITNAYTLTNFNTLLNARFVEQNHIIVDYTTLARLSWNINNVNGSMKIQFDENQVIRDVQAAYTQQNHPAPNSSINLSADNIIYITPVAAHGSSMKLSLSEFLIDILPKIKIGVLYTPPVVQVGQQAANLGNVQVNRAVFLDDGTWQLPSQMLFPQATANDIYHEITIAGDANIIWDACRNEMI